MRHCPEHRGENTASVFAQSKKLYGARARDNDGGLRCKRKGNAIAMRKSLEPELFLCASLTYAGSHNDELI